MDLRVHSPSYSRDGLMVGDANRDALAYIDLWPDWPGHALAIEGPAGSGKTHLGHIWARRAGALCVEAADLGGLDIGALGAGRPVLVERIDAEALAEKALFHLYNWTREQGGWLLLTTRTAPARLPLGLPDLVSRLATVPVVKIGAPDEAMLTAVLEKHFRDRQLVVAHHVLDFVLRRCERSFAAMERIAEGLDREALASRSKVTIALAKQILDRLDRADH